MKEVAAILDMNTRTLDTHAGEIYRKYGVENRIGLIILIYEERLKELEARRNPKGSSDLHNSF